MVHSVNKWVEKIEYAMLNEFIRVWKNKKEP